MASEEKQEPMQQIVVSAPSSMRIVLIASATVLALAGVLGGIWFAVAGAASPAPSTPAAAPARPRPRATWRPVAQWEGSTEKMTETFHVEGPEWRISWDTRPGAYGDMNFVVEVRRPGSIAPVALAANAIGASRDSTVMRGAGDYYLAVHTSQPFVITVEEK